MGRGYLVFMKMSERDNLRLQQILDSERPLWESGQLLVAGADEVGRGPLAGPVVAVCIVMPPSPLIPGVFDSKQLAPAKRIRLRDEILSCAVAVGYGLVDNAVIDRIGIGEATKRAFISSIKAASAVLGRPPDHLFTDTVRISADCPRTACVHADQHSYNAAAASIVAKVYRDSLMMKTAETYPQYGFDQHKGYGTPEHRRLIAALGPAPVHRRSFLGHLEDWKRTFSSLPS